MKTAIDMTPIILSEFDKMLKNEQASREIWKVRAYKRFLSQIKLLDHPIYTTDDIKDLPGVGKKILARVQEIIDTGKLQQVEAIEDDIRIINELMEVHGIGPAKAKDLVRNHGVLGVEDLAKSPHLLNDIQKLGIKYHADFKARIPRKEMLKHEVYLKDVIAKYIPGVRVEIVGSFRRQSSSSGDIDVLIRCDEDNSDVLKSIIAHMRTDRYIVDTFALGPKKYMGVCKVKFGRKFRRLDVLVTSKQEFPYALLYFTGSAEFNTKLRAWVLSSKQLSLSEHGLKNPSTGETIDTDCIEDEEGLFSFLGLKYIEPKDREATVGLELI